MLRKLTVACLGSVALLAAGAGPAFAGEITGNGKPTSALTHANSICAYSGQNDTPSDPFPEGGRVQNYGQLVRMGMKGQLPSPGVACNGHTSPWAGGGGA
jgi:hypothetical protein